MSWKHASLWDKVGCRLAEVAAALEPRDPGSTIVNHNLPTLTIPEHCEGERCDRCQT
jgi:hypothetical protein